MPKEYLDLKWYPSPLHASSLSNDLESPSLLISPTSSESLHTRVTFNDTIEVIEDSVEMFKELKKYIKSGSHKHVEMFKAQLQQMHSENNGEIINFQDPDDDLKTLLHIAGEENHGEIIKLLLQAGADPNKQNKLGKTPLHSVIDGGCRCLECSEKRVDCIKLLINSGAFPNPEDHYKNTPLYYCAQKLYSQCAKTLLDHGANLYHRNGGTSIVARLAQYLPEVVRYELDKCVEYDPENCSKLQVDFRLLLQIQGAIKKLKDGLPPPETELLECVTKARDNGYERVVTHPVVQAFLHFKWNVVRRLFFLIRSIYFILVILYTFLIFRIYSNQCINDSYFGGLGEFCPLFEFDRISAIILCSSAGLIALFEFYKLYTNWDGYFSKGSTGLLWWILSIIWGGTLIPIFGPPPLYYHYPLAAIGVLYSWLMTLVQLDRMPWFAIYVGLFVKVAKDFLKLLVTFSTILIAFTLTFHVLLPDNPHFNNLPFALFKTLMMMKGDIDYEGIMDRQTNPFLVFPEYSVPAHLIYTFFMIIVTMLLTALLIGLAIKDIEEAEKQAKLDRYTRLIKEIGTLESLIRNPFFTCGLAKYFCKWFSIERTDAIKSFHFSFSPFEPDDNTLPEDIRKDFIPYYDKCACQKRIHR